MKVCVCAGGTGGHIYPALALANELNKRNHEIIYIGHSKKMEAKIVRNETEYPFFGLNNAGLTRGLLTRIKALISQFGAIKDAKKILKEEKVDAIVSFGGYVTFPVCIAAQQLKIPYYLHEQNAFAGKANKALEKKAKAVFICYEKVRTSFSNPATHLFGNPRATDLMESTHNANILSDLGVDANKPIVYLVMGSLGSSSVAEIIIEMVNQYDFENVQLVISSGVNNYKVYQDGLKKTVFLYEHLDQASLLRYCDLVVSRAGATSLAELMAVGVPSILIPSPYVANNHQFYNAQACVEAQAAIMCEEKELSASKLYHLIKDTLDDSKLLNKMKENTSRLSFPKASYDIASMVEDTQ